MLSDVGKGAFFSRLVLLVFFYLTACAPESEQAVLAKPVTGTVPSKDDVLIRYAQYGQAARTLVLVHGWSCDRSYWSGQVESLAEDYSVITIDLGGHGESGMERDDWAIASFGADVAAVIEALDLDSVVLVGHSMGGDVIFQAALLLPGKVDALIMVDTYKKLGVARSDSEIDEFVAKFSEDFPGVTESFVRGFFPEGADPVLVERVALDMAAAPEAVALSAIRSSFEHAREIPSLIAELDVPIVAINPDDAPTDLTSMGEYGVRVEIVPGLGHFLMMEDPGTFNDILVSVVEDFE